MMMMMKQTLVAWLLFPIWVLGTDQSEETCLSMDGNSCVGTPAATDRNDSSSALYFGEDMGVKQEFAPQEEPQVQKVLQSARDYLQNVILSDQTYRPILDQCKNHHESCALWASLGECNANPRYMTVSCAPVCQACEQFSREARCPLDPNAVDAFYPGDLDKMFQRLTTDPSVYAKYEPKVWSRPYPVPGDSNETNTTYQLGPWLVTFDNFITPYEANRLIELGKNQGYERSGLVGGMKPDGSIDSYVGDEVRTSSNTWCTDACMLDPSVQTVTSRIVNLTGIRDPNYEFLQLLQYEEGQFYKPHTDYIDLHIQRQEGVRLLTFYMYLNDVEEGGGTRFPLLDLKVSPKQGRAVMWASVLNEDPNEVDDRTQHEALPVIKGVKYGANAWIHQRDFKTAFAKGCE